MPNNRIKIRLAGGLGNQLFQFAAVLKASENLKCDYNQIFVDTRFLSSYEIARSLEINFIAKYYSDIQFGSPKSLIDSNVLRFRFPRFINSSIYKYAFINTVDRLMELQPNVIKYVYLDGYFQHKLVLFEEGKRVFLKEKILLEKNTLIRSFKKSGKTIGIHIRRGDYVSSKKASKIFRSIPLEYYKSALALLPNDRCVLIFSDDRELSAIFSNEINGIDIRGYNLSLEDEFCLLASCDDYVISNSTFSWWAAYLGYSKEKKVIAPLKWYHNENRNNKNTLLLNRFMLMDY